jgi:hypothetical protein
VRRELALGDVAGLRDLAGRLESEGIAVSPDVLRADVRALGAVRVQRGGSSVLALPVDDGSGRPTGPGGSADAGATARLANEISADPDWKLQVGVVAVVAVFVLVALLGWLISV